MLGRKSRPKPRQPFWDYSDIPTFMVWNRLKSLRLSAKLTITQLSVKCDVSTSAIYQLENGLDGKTGIQIKEKFARFFEAEISDIFPVEMIGGLTKQAYLARKIKADKARPKREKTE